MTILCLWLLDVSMSLSISIGFLCVMLSYCVRKTLYDTPPPQSNKVTLIPYEYSSELNLKLIFYTKTQKYLHNKHYTLLTHMVDKRIMEIKDIPYVCNLS